MRFYLVLLMVAYAHCTAHSKNGFEKIVGAAMDVIASSQLDSTVRECSCKEDEECVKSMQDQALHCANHCWNEFSEITKDPHSLYKCLEGKAPVVSGFIRCIGEHLKSCVNSEDGPQIAQVDLRKMFDVGEQRLLSARVEMLESGAFSNLRPIGEAALHFGGCVKKCFVEEENADGFCYEKKRCQPLITENHLRRSLRTCITAASWKNHASDLCECALHAGVGGLDNVCSLLRAARNGRP